MMLLAAGANVEAGEKLKRVDRVGGEKEMRCVLADSLENLEDPGASFTLVSLSLKHIHTHFAVKRGFQGKKHLGHCLLGIPWAPPF